MVNVLDGMFWMMPCLLLNAMIAAVAWQERWI